MILQLLAIALAGTPGSDPGSAFFITQPKPLVAAPAFFNGGEGAELSYSYIEAGLTTYDVDDLSNDNVDTYYGRVSVSLLKLLYVFGQYENSSTDFQNTDTNQVTVGAGAHFDPSPRISLYGQIGYIFNSVSSDSSSLEGDESGYRVDGGVRWMVLPWSGGGVELDGGVGYIDLKNQLASSEHPTVYDVGARVHFLGHFSVGATYEKIDVDDRLLGDVRFSF